MSFSVRASQLLKCLLVAVAMLTSPTLWAETVEQKVRLQIIDPGDGSQCQVKAIFKGDHDNCKNKNARGRDDCAKDTGCICTRQEKHVSWQMEGKEPFSIKFDQGSDNPFVQNGNHECKFKSNKKGKLRCRVKGKNVPKGSYRYSVDVAHCKPAQVQIKVY